MNIDNERIVSSKGIKYNRIKEIEFGKIEDRKLHTRRQNVFPLMAINRNNQRILLSKPVEVNIFSESGHYIAENKNLKLKTEGSSPAEAMKSFVEELTTNFEEYDLRMDKLIEEQIMKRYSGAWDKLAKL